MLDSCENHRIITLQYRKVLVECRRWILVYIGNQSSAEVHVNENGTVMVIEGSPDIGGSRASMCLMAAETLGIDQSN